VLQGLCVQLCNMACIQLLNEVESSGIGARGRNDHVPLLFTLTLFHDVVGIVSLLVLMFWTQLLMLVGLKE
jgi:hypothetical protein